MVRQMPQRCVKGIKGEVIGRGPGFACSTVFTLTHVPRAVPGPATPARTSA